MRRSFSGKIRADRLESGGRLQKPEPLLEGATPLSFFTDAKAEAGRAWIGGFLELVEGCQGVWFSLEVEAKKTSRVAIRGYIDNQSNESLLRK
ncbi:unnamed protein product, partial [Symbiodinium microadriaticum]